MSISTGIDRIIHKYARFPYSLHITEFHAPKKYKEAIVLLHGIGGSAQAWEDLVPLLPRDARIIGVDLLGFGQSPKPEWAKYSASEQAHSLGVTLLKLGLTKQIVLIGHSLGALTAIEVAKRYPFVVKRLVLCSPPFYHINEKKAISYQKVLRQIYRTAIHHSDKLLTLEPIITKLGLTDTALSINKKNVNAYTTALASSIINQTSLQDVAALDLPITILYGALDPLVISRHIDRLGKKHANIITRKLPVAHDTTRRYSRYIGKEVNALLAPQPDNSTIKTS